MISVLAKANNYYETSLFPHHVSRFLRNSGRRGTISSVDSDSATEIIQIEHAENSRQKDEDIRTVRKYSDLPPDYATVMQKTEDYKVQTPVKTCSEEM